MRIPTVFVALVTAALVSCAAPTLEEEEQDSIFNFLGVLGGAGINALSLNGYGCYCGWGNAGDDKVPIDATDACCKVHDDAWGAAGAGGRLGANGQACSCSTEPYTYTSNNGVVTCNANQGACATYCCNADVAFTTCVNAAAASYNPTCRGVDRATCSTDGNYECCGDADCEGGLWCNLGECVPYCGGGTRWKAATGTCEDAPVDETIEVSDDVAEPATITPAPTDDRDTVPAS